MSQTIIQSFIPVAIFFAVLLIFLPVSADNVTMTVTTAPAVTNITTAPTAAVTNTTVVPPVTTVLPAVTNVTTAVTTIAATQTTNATTLATAAPTTTVTTVITTANATPPAVTAGTTGDVKVYSSPTGASILIDGIYSGTTPGTVKNVPAGNHILRLSLSGYHDYEGSLYIIPGQENQGYGTLQPISIVTSASTPAPTAIAVIVPVTPQPEQTQDPGLFGNSSVVVAIIGAIGVLVAAGASVFTHVKPPKKE